MDHLKQGQLQTIEQFHFVKPQLLKLQNRNNETLYGALYKPDDEQGRYQKPYPTLVSVYGGPHLQRYVREREKSDELNFTLIQVLRNAFETMNANETNRNSLNHMIEIA